MDTGHAVTKLIRGFVGRRWYMAMCSARSGVIVFDEM